MILPSNFFEETLVTIVLYETEPEKSSTYLSLSSALQKAGGKMDLFFYDNSPAKQQIPNSDKWTIRYEHDPTNGGVSKAYNRACEVAKEFDKKWLWLLDQDDHLSEDSIASYQKAVKENPGENIFVPIVVDEKSTICSPFRKRFGGGARVKTIAPGIYPLNLFLLINSGLFISVSAFEQAGGYDETFPLDFSDLDFVQRLRKGNERFVVIPTTVQHSLSINTNQPIEKRLNRFTIYLKSAKLFKKKYREANRSIVLRSFIMATKLSLRHSSWRFLQEYFLILY